MSGRVIWGITVLLASLGSSAVYAQSQGLDAFNRAAKFELKKKKEINLNMEKENRVRGTFAVSRSATVEKRPGFDYDNYKRQRAKLVFAKRQQAIALSEKLLKRSNSRDVRVKIKLQLAELYMENYDYYYLIDNESYNQAMKRYSGKGKAPKLSLRRAHTFRDKAVKIYEEFYRTEKNHAQRDEILYFLGYIETTRDRHDRALKYFTELLTRYPRSHLVAETELKVGDYYFDNGRVDQAVPYFKKLSARRHPLAIYGRYKMAWCFYNQKKFQNSIDEFKEVVRISQENKDQKGAFDLTEEALDDLVPAYAEAALASEAKRYFSRVGGDKYYYKMLQKLADIYFSTGRMPQAVGVYRELLEIDPLHKKAPDFQRNIIEAQRVMNARQDMRVSLEQYVAAYNSESRWSEANKDNPGLVEEAVEAGEFAMRKFAKEAHFVAQKTKKKMDYQSAINFYSLYLKYFLKTEYAYEMSFFYAEAMFQVEDYKKSLEWYSRVSKIGKKGKHYADATYGGILAFLADKKKEAGPQQKPEEKKRGQIAPVAFAEHEGEFMDLVERFSNDFPKDARSVDLMYQAGYLCFEKNQFDCSAKKFSWVIQYAPKDERAMFGAHLILDSLNLRDRYAEMSDQARKFYTHKELGDAKFKSEMRDIMAKSRFKALEQLEKSGKHYEAAQGYAQLGTSEKTLGIGDKALYNAAVNFAKAGDQTNSLKFYSMVGSQYPQSSLAAPSILYAANHYNTRLKTKEASAALMRYAQIAPRAPDAPNALYDAAVLMEAEGQYGDAANAFRTYATTYRDKEDAPYAYRKNCEMFWKRRQAPQAIKCYEGMHSIFSKNDLELLYAEGAILEILVNRKEQSAIFRRQQRIVENYSRRASRYPADAKNIIAQAHFETTQGTLDRFNAIRLNTTNGGELQRRMGAKLKMIAQIEKDAADLLKVGSGDWGVPGVYRMAVAYENFAKELLNAPKPPGLTQQQVELYDGELRKIAEPLENKAFENYQKAYELVQNLKVYTPWASRVYSKLSAFNSSRYPVLFEDGLQSQYLSEFAGEK